jgi:hypothetical protein
LTTPLIDTLPDPDHLHARLGDALREVRLLRGLLRLARLAEQYRECDRHSARPCARASRRGVDRAE